MGKLTIENIKNYVEGRGNQLLSSIDQKSDSFIEQINHRKSLCVDCLQEGKCKYCGCQVPGRLYSTTSCNKGERFPDLMPDEQWEEFKKNNNEKFQ